MLDAKWDVSKLPPRMPGVTQGSPGLFFCTYCDSMEDCKGAEKKREWRRLHSFQSLETTIPTLALRTSLRLRNGGDVPTGKGFGAKARELCWVSPAP